MESIKIIRIPIGSLEADQYYINAFLERGWTKQTMIDHVKANFRGKSVDKNSYRCVYRGENGAKCAIGMFIPDDMYHSEMDKELGSNIGMVLARWHLFEANYAFGSSARFARISRCT